MIIHNLNVFRAFADPHETNPLLIVNPDTELTFPCASQWFEVIARRTPKIIQGPRFVKILQLSTGYLLHILSQYQRALPAKVFLGFLAGKTNYH